jgi:hypothetical protein
MEGPARGGQGEPNDRSFVRLVERISPVGEDTVRRIYRGQTIAEEFLEVIADIACRVVREKCGAPRSHRH